MKTKTAGLLRMCESPAVFSFLFIFFSFYIMIYHQNSVTDAFSDDSGSAAA